MGHDSLSEEKRDFFRVNFNSPLEYRAFSPSNVRASETSRSSVVPARSRNISQSGILFQTETNPPQLSSILWLNLDIRTIKICQEIDRRCLIHNNGLLGRVVRVEENTENDAYDVGVCFLTRDQKNSDEVKELIAEISKPA